MLDILLWAWAWAEELEELACLIVILTLSAPSSIMLAFLPTIPMVVEVDATATEEEEVEFTISTAFRITSAMLSRDLWDMIHPRLVCNNNNNRG